MYRKYIKRLLDYILAVVLLVALSPIMLLAAIAIKLEDPKGLVLFKQERVGKNGRIFKIYKFRTMKVDNKAEKNFDSSKDAERITFIGKILRRTKIDELPQLFNVVKGDMALVGPRPTIKIQVDNYTSREMRRLKVRPGMTGLAQVNGNVALPWDKRIEYDVFYVDNYSVILDIKILLKTIAIILFGEKHFKKEITKAST
ncbi:sugar transferase [Tepidanaerobacter syntrophicus]|uniref:Sugar transferase n=1 Tax=Tepidanaerobacter syntrophicus TaxID=224999 RepID=A0A0U9HKI0_9FIRM|nr:sugar transferase [Tepidanaerobacter syntrophicus]GAQ24575.1 sugar transferase [Tepidanaerobacter syntrophicus]GLI19849.1 multidrug MFS transporter [Tepidanaerobacter syntrophicus]